VVDIIRLHAGLARSSQNAIAARPTPTIQFVALFQSSLSAIIPNLFASILSPASFA
jgi:hypothetical protein